ncbi:MAG TPA: SRPBCC family protein [Chryseolinea sp.]|nr:SRPBCC family protein [Chryseolinea sp.]HPM29648.1 SRPBCC family protein [Chryseolinea sp.]
MSNEPKTVITIETVVKSPIEKVWQFWSESNQITQWCSASDDWHTPYADNDLRTGGKFKSTMAAKDGSVSFDFEGVYTNVQKYKLIEYDIADGRKVEITFSGNGNETKVVESFEAEGENPIEMQRGGWQAILDNFKKHTENN